jgi:hypothetical protein
MTIDENQFAFLYFLLEARDKGEYMPLSMLRILMREDVEDERLIALSLENAGFVECAVDDRLLGNARYKYKLSPEGFEFVRNILRTPVSQRVAHTVRRPK